MNARTPFAIAVLVVSPLATTRAGAAERRALPAASPTDLAVSAPLVAVAPVVDADRAPLAASWALPGDAPWTGAPAPHVAESREHWLRVTPRELANGVDPAIASAAAIVRISPLAARRGSAPPEPFALDEIVVIAADGVERRGGEAVATLVGAEDLAAAGADFSAGTVALRLRPELGDGPFRLRVDGAAERGATGYLLHVFEPASSIVLALGADRSAYASGGTGALELRLADGGRTLAVDGGIVGFVLSPGGRSQSLRFAPAPDGALRASFVTRGESGARGLWQAEVAVTTAGEGGGLVRRSARTAFEVALPTAALAGELALEPLTADRALRFAVPVDVGAPGRYTARATLARRGADGAPVAIARGESSAWLERGRGELTLEFDAAALAGAAAGDELELVELELADPGRMGLLERRALALPLVSQR